jgi:uncharacterized OB-fold protein
MDKETARKPVPHPNEVSAPYWESLEQGVLSLQRCTTCKKFRHYPRLVCDSCYSLDVEWVESSGRGEVHSWTVAHHAFHPGFVADLPYVLAVVDLEEGVRAMGRLRGIDPAEIRIGLPVEFTVEQRDDGVALPAFVPVSSKG